jgi:hypothetical protein
MNATPVTRRRFVWGLGQAAVITCFGAQAIDAVQGALRAGTVSYIGEQQEIFKTGRASASVSLGQLAGLPHLYAIGPVEGLDGEITIFNSEPHVSKVRGSGDAYIVDRTFDHGAIFLVWAQVREWNVITVPQTVSSYRELETVVREMARQNGIDTDVPFPFLIGGTPHELVWHINVDRTEGQAITRDLFWKSKQQYTLRGERVDILGVYSEKHSGVFMPQGSTIHIHFISQSSPATGHIDAIVPGSFTLRLPRA